MYKELEHRDDQSLLDIYTADPISVEGKAADALLRYRQYKATKAHNNWLIVLTLILVVSAVAQSIAAVKSVAGETPKQGFPQGAVANQSLSVDPFESAKFKELIERVQKLEHRLGQEDKPAPDKAPVQSKKSGRK